MIQHRGRGHKRHHGRRRALLGGLGWRHNEPLSAGRPIPFRAALLRLLQRDQEGKVRQLADVDHDQGLSEHLDRTYHREPSLNRPLVQLLNAILLMPSFSDVVTAVRADLRFRLNHTEICLRNRLKNRQICLVNSIQGRGHREGDFGCQSPHSRCPGIL
jgi:hypothetical protein